MSSDWACCGMPAARRAARHSSLDQAPALTWGCDCYGPAQVLDRLHELGATNDPLGPEDAQTLAAFREWCVRPAWAPLACAAVGRVQRQRRPCYFFPAAHPQWPLSAAWQVP